MGRFCINIYKYDDAGNRSGYVLQISRSDIYMRKLSIDVNHRVILV
jgi:hypothetical protein